MRKSDYIKRNGRDSKDRGWSSRKETPNRKNRINNSNSRELGMSDVNRLPSESPSNSEGENSED
jgi:hypothetical protein